MNSPRMNSPRRRGGASLLDSIEAVFGRIATYSVILLIVVSVVSSIMALGFILQQSVLGKVDRPPACEGPLLSSQRQLAGQTGVEHTPLSTYNRRIPERVRGGK